ncbi:MAG TPA: hypothetical protein DDW76_36690 [Cyanobacteria bacterium UBA11369]|nr:hypothetical protein [Cyanobacteria bacterium UBA11371]HBE35012.1 hypothetical protein [Cyanobacteria bacterium UBA11368]HBE54144.1 hypothetical protein [Cyanobacteria bacterium UBA11369]
MNIEEALTITDDLLFAKTGQHLTELQKVILQASWEDYTYKDVARKFRYREGHIKNEASLLWELLSKILEVPVSKKTFRGKLEKRSQSDQVPLFQVREQWDQPVTNLYQDWEFRGKLEERFKSERVPHSQVREQWDQPVATPYQDWGNAPILSYFYGRTQELHTLERWILQDKCQLILLLGEGGIGKTTLAI